MFYLTSASLTSMESDNNDDNANINFLIPASGSILLRAQILYSEPEVTPCLTDSCYILTPNGYINITKLNIGDVLYTNDKRKVIINKIYKNTLSTKEINKPFKIPKHFFEKNKPDKNTFISENHAYLYNKKWRFPKDDNLKKEWNNDTIIYYNLKVDNYNTDNLVVNNLVMESWDGLNPHDKRNYKWKKTKKGMFRYFKP